MPTLARPAWPPIRAVLIGLLVASASAATFAALRDTDLAFILAHAAYPWVAAVVFAIPALLVVRFAPPLPKALLVAIAALCCALPLALLVAIPGPAHWERALPFIASHGLAGGLGALAFLAFRQRPGRRLRVVFWLAVAAIFLPTVLWVAAGRVPDQLNLRGEKFAWERADPRECVIMARSIREMKFDQLPGRPPLIGERKTGGPCNWTALGVPLSRVTTSEFRAAAERQYPQYRYIEHIGVSRPLYSLLRLRARVEVSHHYGHVGGDGFHCTFQRRLTGWKLVSCERAWIS